MKRDASAPSTDASAMVSSSILIVCAFDEWELLLRRHHGARLLLGEDRQPDQQQLHPALRAQRELFAARERRILAQRLPVDLAFAIDDEADLDAATCALHGARARLELEHRKLQLALGEDAEVL